MANPFKRLFRHSAADTPTVTSGEKTLSPDGLPVVQWSPEIVNVLRHLGVGGSYGVMYVRQPNIRTVVDDIAREAAELKMKMYVKESRGDFLPSERIEVSDHEMAQLLVNPAEGMSSYNFWFSTFADILIYDTAFWYIVRPRPGARPSGLVRIPPVGLTPDREPVTMRVRGWRTSTGGYLTKNDVIVFWGYDPESNESAVSPMETLRRILADEYAAMLARDGMWGKSLRKDGVIERDIESPHMSDEALESFLIDAEDSLANAGGSYRPFVLQPGMRWKDTQWSPREMEYISARRLTRTEVAAAFHVPPAKVAASQNGQEPDEATSRYFYQSTLPPYLSRVEAEVQAQLLPMFVPLPSARRNYYVKFNLDEKLRGSFEERAAIGATTAGGPIVTVNEARARVDLPPIEGGDLIFVPLNSVRGGGPQGAPSAPVQTPAEGMEPAGTTPGGGVVQQSSPNDPNTLTIGGQRQRVRAGNGKVSTGDYEQLIQDVRGTITALDERDAKAKGRAEHTAFMRATRPRYEERHLRTMEKFFERQRNIAVTGRELARARWDRELSDDLFGVAYQTVDKFGSDAAERMEGDWNSERAVKFIRAAVTNTAKRLNDETIAYLANDDVDFEIVFGEERAGKVATEQTTYWMNWAVMEAAHQNGEV